jgi:hypothetical protein
MATVITTAVRTSNATLKSTILSMTVDAPWYMPTAVIRRDLQITIEIRRYSSHYRARLSAHLNDPIGNLVELPDT